MLINVLLEILGVIFLWLGLALSILIHETGHMAGYKLAKGKKDWIIQVGFGKTLIKTKNYDIRILPFSGVFYNPDSDNTYTKAQALMCSAGCRQHSRTWATRSCRSDAIQRPIQHPASMGKET